jgi:hypothetical protein
LTEQLPLGGGPACEAGACAFLVDNPAVNGIDLFVDGGISCV